MKKIELLAPAGSIESLMGAVQSGADAVYLGGTKFSARAYASNFDEEKMKWAVEYCHKYGVKIYVTMNTLIKNSEMEEALKYANFLYTIGVDALIVQDLGLSFKIKELVPDMELHASTQMTVHNGEGAKYLWEKGFQRIVLSRELNINEIKYISTDLNIETEIFVHGALCISYSGQCLMSSMIGGRSGNRGRCAQTCRLPYALMNSDHDETGFIMSPKDVNTLEEIEAIIKSGTASLKIEGRMKRPEYVVGVVSSYRKAIDSVYNKIKFEAQEENKKLMQLFNREGFSKAYMFGNVGKDMMAYNFPKNTGLLLGKVKKNKVLLEQDIALGDGVRVGEDGFTVSKIKINNKEAESASKGQEVELFPNSYKNNDYLYKTQDSKLLKNLSEIIKEYGRKIDLNLEVEFELGKPIVLGTEYEGRKYTVKGTMVDKAINKPLDKEKLIKNLEKSGDTPFKFSNIKFNSFSEGFLPVSSINEIRRNLIECVEKDLVCCDRVAVDNLDEKIKNILSRKNTLRKAEDKFLAVANISEQFKALSSSAIENIGINIVSRKIKLPEIKNTKDKNIYLKVPNIVKDSEFEKVCKIVDEYLPYAKGLITANLGIINKYKDKSYIVGDYKLNILNSCTGEFFEKDLGEAYLSVELNRKEISELLKQNTGINLGMIAYGKYELMISEYCPIGARFGGKSTDKECNVACTKDSYKLKDRKGAEFTVQTDINCKSYIYNSVPTYLFNEIDSIKKLNINSFRLDFVDETYQEVMEIINNLSDNREVDMQKYTRGHYKRGIE